MQTALMTERRASAIGALLVALGPISLALYTPAMPTLVTVFATDMSTVKLTMTFYFIGFTFAQLVCGPLSDAYGRRPVVLWFLAGYLVGSFMAFSATTIEFLLVGRLVQGIGASCGIAISRAIIRDQYTGDKGAGIMNLIGMMLAAGPAFAPVIGSIALELTGWASIFGFMVAYGAIVLTAIVLLVPETNRHRDSALINPRRLARSYRFLLGQPLFLVPALILGLTIGGFYTLATILPFVLIDQVGLSPLQFGIGMLMQTGCFFLGGLATRLLLKRFPADKIAGFGSLLNLMSGLALFAGYLYVAPSYLSVMVPVGGFAFGTALMLPSMTVRGLHPFPKIAGAASAMMGFVQIGVGLVGSAMAAVVFDDAQTAVTMIITGMTVLTALIYWSGKVLLPKDTPVLDVP